MLLVVLMGSCSKDANPYLSSFSSEMSSADLSAALVPQAGTLEVVNLGIAGDFAILSKTGITDVFKSTITGDIGSSPITGAAILVSCAEVTGTIYSVNAAGPLPCRVTNPTRLTTAVSDMQTAYTDAAGRANPDFLNPGAGNIGGNTLTPGLYKWSTNLLIPTDVTISGGPNDVWIFQVAGTLTMSSAVRITLAGGAQAKNIFWVVAGSVNCGTTSHFEGNILGQTSINLQTGASINGRMLAQTAVNLQMNTVSFTPGDAPDTILPAVYSTDPENNATGVAIDRTIVATFSEPMDLTTINSLTFTLQQESASVEGTVSYTGTTASFIPAGVLQNNKIYTGTVTTGVKDIAGNSMVVNHTFSFTTVEAPDIILPVVNSTNPLNNAIDVARNKVVALTFSELMDPLTLNASTFTLYQAATPVSGTVAYSGTTATFTPLNSLANGIAYTATITTGAKDLAGNALAVNTVWNFTTIIATSGQAMVNLGVAGNFAILAKTGITDVYKSAITGNIGASPITGAAILLSCAEVTGTIYTVDAAGPLPCRVTSATMLTTAVSDMEAAYTDAAGRANPDFVELGAGNIGGKTLTPGLYKWTSAVVIPTDVTISGGPDDVWIFQISGLLTMSSAVKITLTGGAQAKNIFWVTASKVTLGTTSHFEGNILGQTSINMLTGSSINGSMLAQTAVTLQMNTVKKPQ